MKMLKSSNALSSVISVNPVCDVNYKVQYKTVNE